MRHAKKTFYLLILVSWLAGTGCSRQDIVEFGHGDLAQLKKSTLRLNSDLVQMRSFVEVLAGYTEELYRAGGRVTADFNPKDYKLFQEKLYYKSRDDGGAVYVATHFSRDPRVAKARARLTPFFTMLMKPLVDGSPAVAQAYFNSADNCSYVYPYFDILQVIPPEMDVRTFNFYFLADEKHNPSRGSVWVGTPYVDPAGQGWMVSVIAPVYDGDTLLGVVGTDLTVHTLTQKYLERTEKPSLLVNHDGLVIATSSEAARILHLPIQEGHKYIEAVNTDTFQPEKFNLLKSPRKPIRALARSIIIEKQSRGWIDIHGERQLVIAAPVPETNWTLWQIIAE